MNSYSTQSLSPKKLLTIATNILHQNFVDALRTDAKRIYRDIAAGKEVALAKLAMEDKSELIVNVSLDASELNGTLSFSGFRKILLAMLTRIAKQLEQQETEELNLFRDEETSQMLFNLPGFELKGSADMLSIANVLVLGIKQSVPGEITFRLMYLEPSQFESLLQPATASASTV